MTLFNKTPDLPLEDISLDNLSGEDKDYLTELVGEGKKFKTPNDLAKGKKTSDDFIAQLQTEMRGLRTELKARNTVDELLKNRSPNPPPENTANNQGNTGDEDNATKDLEALLERKLTEREQTGLKQRNLDIVKQKLVDTWGANFPAELRAAAKQLGLGEQFLDTLASEQPQAFFKLIGIDSNQGNNQITPLPVNSRPSERLTTKNTGSRNYAFWENERKRLGDQFWQPKYQQALWKDLQAMGEEEFYKS